MTGNSATTPPEPPKARKKPGPPKGVRYGGKQKGTKNKRTIERERAAQLELERAALAAKAAESGSEVDKARAQQHRLMKDVGMDMTRLAAGLAAYYQPWPQWVPDGLGGQKNANPNHDEGRFRYYLEMSLQGARDFAAFESPKLAAVMLQADIVETVRIEGGLPDEQDGGMVDAPDGGGRAYLGEPGWRAPWDDAPAGVPAGDRAAADVPSGAGAAVPPNGQAEGGPVRKALG